MCVETQQKEFMCGTCYHNVCALGEGVYSISSLSLLLLIAKRRMCDGDLVLFSLQEYSYLRTRTFFCYFDKKYDMY